MKKNNVKKMIIVATMALALQPTASHCWGWSDISGMGISLFSSTLSWINHNRGKSAIGVGVVATTILGYMGYLFVKSVLKNAPNGSQPEPDTLTKDLDYIIPNAPAQNQTVSKKDLEKVKLNLTKAKQNKKPTGKSMVDEIKNKKLNKTPEKQQKKSIISSDFNAELKNKVNNRNLNKGNNNNADVLEKDRKLKNQELGKVNVGTDFSSVLTKVVKTEKNNPTEKSTENQINNPLKNVDVEKLKKLESKQQLKQQPLVNQNVIKPTLTKTGIKLDINKQ